MFRRAWLLPIALSLPAFAASAQDANADASRAVAGLVPADDGGAYNTECYYPTDLSPTVNFRIDNDLFGTGHQDQGYTNGAQLTFVSPNLKNYTDDPCLPHMARWLNNYLAKIAPRGYDQQNMVFSIAQRIYTPDDPTRKGAIADDRPYAGVLVAGFGYNARRKHQLTSTTLYLGLVGPHAYGEQVQAWVHQWSGSEKFEGWDNQLRDEPVFQLGQERMRRYFGDHNDERTWGFDAVSHYGAAVGNLATYANVGAEFRFGRHLPNDFGSTPLRPAGENTAPGDDASGVGRLWRFHWFVTFDERAVLHDITLDGNTFGDSHSSIDRKPFVGYAGYGFALMKGRWKFAFARYWSTREFDQQKEKPEFGSFTISRGVD